LLAYRSVLSYLRVGVLLLRAGLELQSTPGCLQALLRIARYKIEARLASVREHASRTEGHAGSRVCGYVGHHPGSGRGQRAYTLSPEPDPTLCRRRRPVGTPSQALGGS
jgi:hypothetical protein